MSPALTVWVRGIGLWAPGMADWTTFRAIVRNEASPGEVTRPVADTLPANERRRAPESVLLAAAAAGQAVAMSGLSAADLACVFASGHGDQTITDYMCATLASAPAELSPIRFHNSVHNAPVGYWTIATHCHAASSAVSAATYSFGAGLLEAAMLAVADERDVLFAAYDIAGTGPLREMTACTGAFAASLVLSPHPHQGAARIDLTLVPGNIRDASLGDARMDGLAHSNPTGAGLRLMEALAQEQSLALRVATADSLDVHLDVEACR
ncbi:beta-ketoacyl synthase-like protein [Luteibacter rhizovicinus]|uniref:Beta-ketoacyl synthase-like protein n=1 Tax=Luteibacter rhizovicinus TaxID=242606 RepID=A0A4R3YWR5_9GAMM|nr:beta-ketoacyl synthase chain length factor [Luteibacter rhizovicinus]TCV96268.1 beta-ketoacyl synthase-like protein [Luteibacter rhizovicinus]